VIVAVVAVMPTVRMTVTDCHNDLRVRGGNQGDEEQ
jgi:hypothetical protein